jgi:hypothetical protein
VGDVDAYISGLAPALARLVAATRAIVDRELAGATCAVLWGGPTWSLGGDPVCYLRATEDAVLFGFWNGGSLDDPSGRMQAHGSIMGHATLRDAGDVDEGLFVSWLRQARALARPRTDAGARGADGGGPQA